MKHTWFRSLLRRRLLVILLLLVQIALIGYVVHNDSMGAGLLRSILQIVSILVVFHVVSEKNKGAYKAAWVFLVLAFPLFGGAFYLLFHLQSSAKQFSYTIARIRKKSGPLYQLPGDAYKRAVQEIPQFLPQFRYLQEYNGFPIFDATYTRYYTPGEAFLEPFLAELEKAEKYIFLEYFIISEGVLWERVLEVLLRKAKEGVEVRVIYDDIGCFLKLPKNYAETLRSYGIQCSVFNPFRPVLSVMQNNRDHRKIASVDGKAAFTGGLNLADEYINARKKYGYWKDSVLLVRGKAAWSMTLMFLETWELCGNPKEDSRKFYPLWNTESTAHGFVQPYADSPMDDENVGEHVYMQILNNAEKYVYITTPYLIIDDSMMSALCLAAKSGVDVRIITPHIWDKAFVHLTTRSFYRELIRGGVKIYEYSKGFIHSKTFVSDDVTAVVGTTNLDFRSLYLDFECGVRMYRTNAVIDVKEDFIKTLAECEEVTADMCQGTIFTRAIQNFLRLFAPLM